MRVRIVSDGTGMDTRVENADTGEVLEDVVAVAWYATGVDDLARVQLELCAIEVDVVGEADD